MVNGILIRLSDTLHQASELGTIVWNLFEQARDKTDAKYLIRAFTVQSKFPFILNQKLIQRRPKKSANHQENDQIQNTMAMFNQGFAMAQALITARLQTDNSHIN